MKIISSASHLVLNGVEIKSWSIADLRDTRELWLKPHEIRQFSRPVGEFCEKPGIYTIRWTGIFGTREVSFRVQPYDGARPGEIALVRQIRAHLPKGWKAFYQNEFSAVVIERSAPVLIYPRVFPSMPSGFKRGKNFPVRFSVLLRSQPRLSPEEYASEKARNQRIGKGLADLHTVLKSIEGKPESFSPKTKEQKLQIEEYQDKRSLLRELPVFYFGDAGFLAAFLCPTGMFCFWGRHRIATGSRIRRCCPFWPARCCGNIPFS
jgi:hypothetical protein